MIDMEQKVEMKWHNANKQWYEDKCYVFTKINDTFTVVAKDLMKWSNYTIKYTCNNCGITIATTYNTYNRNKDDLCNPCGTKLKSKYKSKPAKASYEDIKEMFRLRGYTLVSTRDDYETSNNKLNYICKDHGLQTIKLSWFKKGYGCRPCATLKFSGSNSHVWKGGKTALNKYIRNLLTPWTQQHLQRTNYRCELTGKIGILNVHHMYGFNNILQDTMTELNMDFRPNIGDYSEDELQLIAINFIKNNDLYAKPIVMLESVHKEFHRFCGGTKEDTSMEQLEEFKATLIT